MIQGFQLLSTDWTVEEVTPTWFKKNIDKEQGDNVYGWVDEQTATIYLITPKGGWGSEEFKELVLRHEIIHCFLFAHGMHVGHDETFVDGIAQIWAQYEKTKYE